MKAVALSPAYPTDLPVWESLSAHFKNDMRSRRISDLFRNNQQRFDSYSLEAGDLFLDYSKNIINANTRELLIQLAREAKVPAAIEAMFMGEPINVSEGRSVLHAALRSKLSDEVALGVPGVSEIWDVLEKMTAFVNGVHAGDIHGVNGRRFKNIVNIGIGGSDLGLVMASRALRNYWQPGINFHSVSNVDGTQLVDLSAQLNPEETLFVICSKSFTTQETMVNANAASEWITDRLGGGAVEHHFAAASTNHEAMDLFGINPDYRFSFWDWVGGRYSIWSAVGLSLALTIGVDRFSEMLAGARRMDQHFRTVPLDQNMPALLALIGIWYNNFFGSESQAILPYDNRLDRLPAFLQQLQMESSGKGVRTDGQPVQSQTGGIIWGEAGSNAQHSFYQLLHQGTRFVPVDFILPLQSSGASQQQHDLAIANCLAQSEALMDGFSMDDEPHRTHPGSRPSNTILMSQLSPSSLGQLIALYEHKVFVEGVIWGINSFDQYGVELGKRLAGDVAPAVSGKADYRGENPSTRRLLERLLSERQRGRAG
ncbi:MAG: glucose-6-phosphate isomerase [Woeseiaceae bacterium]|nr:glucose-6-phosphate isomerase [Woeseiaceae bacterium]